MAMEVEKLERVLRASNKIKLEPLKQWYCDHCGEIIKDVNAGWLEWLKDDRTNIEDRFRIVHNDKKCIYNERLLSSKGLRTKDMHLDHYIGPDGLNNLLEIMLRPIIDREELVKIIKRLHIPYYEQSLQYRDEAASDGYFSADPDLYCNVEDNLRLIEEYENNR